MNKPKGITSFDLCFKLRKVLKTKSIGHTGTLDPNATGVMVVLSHQDTKLNQFLVGATKSYECEVLLGLETDTLDICGQITKQADQLMPSKQVLETALKSFLGPQTQTPPLTSAIKVKGKKLYEYQREHKSVEIPVRKIEIFELKLLNINQNTFTFQALVSSGTYIRSLVRDLLSKLNLIGCLNNLKRTSLGPVTLNDCIDLDRFLINDFQAHNSYEVLSKLYECIEIDDVYKVVNGQKLSLKAQSDIVVLVKDQRVLAIYERVDQDIFKCKRGLF